MTHVFRLAVFVLFVLLAACAQGGGGKPAAPVSQLQGGATYSPLAMAERADAPGALEAAGRTFVPRPINDKNLGSGDRRPTDTFRYYFVEAVRAAKPKRVVLGGNGAGLATAFTAHAVAEREELQAAMNDILARYPARHAVDGVLMRGTNRKYVVQISFIADGASHALYYDVSRWVDYVREHG